MVCAGGAKGKAVWIPAFAGKTPFLGDNGGSCSSRFPLGVGGRPVDPGMTKKGLINTHSVTPAKAGAQLTLPLGVMVRLRVLVEQKERLSGSRPSPG